MKSKPLVSISQDDIYGHAKSLGIKLTKDEAIEIFDNIDPSDFNCDTDTFWSFVENKIKEYTQ